MVRFQRFVSPEPNTGCWLWAGADDQRRGYGRFGLGSEHQVVAAHRFAWEAANGPVPPGLFVCHRCDLPACVNPDHLFVGSHDDNMRDMVAKDRARFGVNRGEANGFAILTEVQVQEIRRRYSPGRPQGAVQQPGSIKALAREFGVSPRAIQRVVRGQYWRHITPSKEVSP